MTNFPISGFEYTLEEMLLKMDLPDSPFLLFNYKDNICIIQISHLTNEELLKIPGMASSTWEYHYTTFEWCPIFWYSDEDIDITTFVDIKKRKNKKEYDDKYLVVPKGTNRKIYI
jgi:hypothetical protein